MDRDNRYKPADSSATFTLNTPKVRSKLIFVDSSVFVINSASKKPNWWWRLWQYLLLGVRWEDVE